MNRGDLVREDDVIAVGDKRFDEFPRIKKNPNAWMTDSSIFSEIYR